MDESIWMKNDEHEKKLAWVSRKGPHRVYKGY
jgi:hypothetical protein